MNITKSTFLLFLFLGSCLFVQSQPFSYTGSVQTYTVTTTSCIKIKAWGAGGGDGGRDNQIGGKGGGGAYSEKTITVNSGDVLQIYVGGGGSSGKDNTAGTGGGSGGWGYGSGGRGGHSGSQNHSGAGGGGGGSSTILLNGNVILVAGGGGGGGGGGCNSGSGHGGGGGQDGQSATPLPVNSGMTGLSTGANGEQGIDRGNGDGGGGGGAGGGWNGGTGGGITIGTGSDCGFGGGAGGGGGGKSLGNKIINGSATIPGNNTDTNLCVGCSTGGTTGGNGIVVISTVSSTIKTAVSSNSPVCEGQKLSLLVSAGANYSWSGPSGFSSTLQNPVIKNVSITNIGTYTVVVTDSNGCNNSATIPVTVNSVYLINKDTAICNGESCFLAGRNQTATGTYYDSLLTTKGCDSIIVTRLTVNPVYQSSKDTTICYGESYFVGGQPQTITGTYYDSLLTVRSCDSIIITQLTVSHPTVSLGEDVIICEGESKVLNVGNFTAYKWQDSTTTVNCLADKAGIYYVQVTDSVGCTASDTIRVEVCKESELWIPNVFTPNKDGKNELFQVVPLNIKEFKADIFNRWGEHLYQWNDVDGGWDGTFKGRQCPDGVYVYIIRAKGVRTTVFDKTGFITLIR